MHCIFLCLRNVHQILCMEPICMFIDDSFSFLTLYTKCQKLLTLSFLYYMMKMSRVFDIQNILPKGENIMPVPAQIFLGVVFLLVSKKFVSFKKPMNPSKFQTHPAVLELFALCAIPAVSLKGRKNTSANNA